MECSVAVNADPYQKSVFCKKISPFLIQGKSVGLNGILNRAVQHIVSLYQLHEGTEKFQPGKSGLAALKDKGYGRQRLFFHGFHRGKRLLYQQFGGIRCHKDRVFLLTQGHFVFIKAVFASHIAGAGGGLD